MTPLASAPELLQSLPGLKPPRAVSGAKAEPNGPYPEDVRFRRYLAKVDGEQLYVWREYDWRKADTASWLADLTDRLPAGLKVWKGVYPDYTTMTAETPLWREGDANACPTGGRAKIILGWRADRVVIRSVRVEHAGECGERTP